ncbi:MAG: hypothetical protein IPP01_12995 [Saprospiraceae bacterium]|nr:hypothetical protein [Saprospiraceae bacterium]
MKKQIKKVIWKQLTAIIERNKDAFFAYIKEIDEFVLLVVEPIKKSN